MSTFVFFSGESWDHFMHADLFTECMKLLDSDITDSLHSALIIWSRHQVRCSFFSTLLGFSYALRKLFDGILSIASVILHFFNQFFLNHLAKFNRTWQGFFVHIALSKLLHWIWFQVWFLMLNNSGQKKTWKNLFQNCKNVSIAFWCVALSKGHL